MIHRKIAIAALTATAACGDNSHGGRLPDAPRTHAAASVLRLPRDRGAARLYRLPALEPSAWKQVDKLPALSELVGADLEQRIVYALDDKHNLVGLDLESHRVRPFLTNVRDAAIGPDGALYAVDSAASVTRLVRRSPVRFRTRLASATGDLFGTLHGSVIALPTGGRGQTVLLSDDQAQSPARLPAGDAAATYLGDLVAVAADTAVILYEPQAKTPVRSLDVSGARAVAFSPSGHRLYVARQRGDIRVIDRVSGEVLETVDLPGPARDLRMHFYGRWLLARPEQGDSVWVVDLAANELAGGVATRWSGDLPVVAGPRTLLLRAGGDVRALDLEAGGFPVTGEVDGGAADAWLPLAWLPAGEARDEEAADSAAADSAAASATVYLQVSSSRNPDWAEELTAKLKGAGLPASVLPPKRGEEAYRVVIGPYATREQAEATGRTLGMPSFVISTQEPE
ncbi:MAG TPA: SPOR domain-containing protein [Gemmatimonadales bacterium]|nr:SPOR domain-containing protein [Gemmatimonadales bacterium]